MEPVVYVLLFVTSVVGLTFIVERGIALRWRRVVPSVVEAAVESCRSLEDVPMLRRVCEQHNSPVSRLLLLASEHLDWPKANSKPTESRLNSMTEINNSISVTPAVARR